MHYTPLHLPYTVGSSFSFDRYILYQHDHLQAKIGPVFDTPPWLHIPAYGLFLDDSLAHLFTQTSY